MLVESLRLLLRMLFCYECLLRAKKRAFTNRVSFRAACRLGQRRECVKALNLATGLLHTVLASFLVCTESLDEPTLPLRNEHRPAIAAADGPIRSFFAF